MVFEWILARYSPMTPRAKRLAPEKMAMMEARNGKPGTTLPWIINRTTTYRKTATPNRVRAKPIMLAICSGHTLNPVIMFNAWVASL